MATSVNGELVLYKWCNSTTDRGKKLQTRTRRGKSKANKISHLAEVVAHQRRTLALRERTNVSPSKCQALWIDSGSVFAPHTGSARWVGAAREAGRFFCPLAPLLLGAYPQDHWLASMIRDISRLVDLGPMPRFKNMNRGIPGLRSHVLGDGDMKGYHILRRMSDTAASTAANSQRRPPAATASSFSIRRRFAP
jgi:hypothetical protein